MLPPVREKDQADSMLRYCVETPMWNFQAQLHQVDRAEMELGADRRLVFCSVSWLQRMRALSCKLDRVFHLDRAPHLRSDRSSTSRRRYLSASFVRRSRQGTECWVDIPAVSRAFPTRESLEPPIRELLPGAEFSSAPSRPAHPLCLAASFRCVRK